MGWPGERSSGKQGAVCRHLPIMAETFSVLRMAHCTTWWLPSGAPCCPWGRRFSLHGQLWQLASPVSRPLATSSSHVASLDSQAINAVVVQTRPPSGRHHPPHPAPVAVQVCRSSPTPAMPLPPHPTSIPPTTSPPPRVQYDTWRDKPGSQARAKNHQQFLPPGYSGNGSPRRPRWTRRSPPALRVI